MARVNPPCCPCMLAPIAASTAGFPCGWASCSIGVPTVAGGGPGIRYRKSAAWCRLISACVTAPSAATPTSLVRARNVITRKQSGWNSGNAKLTPPWTVFTELTPPPIRHPRRRVIPFGRIAISFSQRTSGCFVNGSTKPMAHDRGENRTTLFVRSGFGPISQRRSVTCRPPGHPDLSVQSVVKSPRFLTSKGRFNDLTFHRFNA
jgi:hypothetical protein